MLGEHGSEMTAPVRTSPPPQRRRRTRWSRGIDTSRTLVPPQAARSKPVDVHASGDDRRIEAMGADAELAQLREVERPIDLLLSHYPVDRYHYTLKPRRDFVGRVVGTQTGDKTRQQPSIQADE
jgi:hypothetical protein